MKLEKELKEKMDCINLKMEHQKCTLQIKNASHVQIITHSELQDLAGELMMIFAA